MERLREQYEKEVVPALMKKFEYKSVMQVPKLEKIVINIGLGDVKDNPKLLPKSENETNKINSDTLINAEYLEPLVSIDDENSVWAKDEKAALEVCEKMKEEKD